MSISITPANVKKSSTARWTSGTAGDTITAGMALYADSTDSGALKPALADTAAHAACVGIALNGAADGQPVSYLTYGTITIGGTAVVGTTYCVDDVAAGAIEADSAISAEKYKTIIGIGTTATTLFVDIQASGVAIPT